MIPFNSEKDADNFKQQLRQYFSLKNQKDLYTLLENSKLECTWQTRDNWNGGIDFYQLKVLVPITSYINLENKREELNQTIGETINNHFIKGEPCAVSVNICIQNALSTQILVNPELEKLNSESIHYLWKKAIDRLENDPDGAITAANTLLEDTIKTILNNLGVDYNDNDDLPKLYRLLSNKLNLSPGQHIEEIFKQILGGCNSVVIGLGSLRNKISDAHASSKRPIKPAKRHAELAVNLAGTMAAFLIATWENNSFKKQ